jgi:hypothetical protein
VVYRAAESYDCSIAYMMLLPAATSLFLGQIHHAMGPSRGGSHNGTSILILVLLVSTVWNSTKFDGLLKSSQLSINHPSCHTVEDTPPEGIPACLRASMTSYAVQQPRLCATMPNLPPAARSAGANRGNSS